MLSSVEQAFVARDEKGAPLKTPAWEATLDWAAYKNFKREVKRELILAEREHVENQIRNNPNDPRCVWKRIRSCIPRKSVKKKSFSDSDDAVAKEFNEFFNSISQNTVEKIYSLANECSYDLTQSSFVPRCYLPSQQFSFRPVKSPKGNYINAK